MDPSDHVGQLVTMDNRVDPRPLPITAMLNCTGCCRPARWFPRPYAEGCEVIDLVIGVAVIVAAATI